MKTAGESAKKFVERGGAASGDYGAGVANTSKDQAGAAIAAAPLYAAGVQAAIARGAFAKGLQKSGTGAWKDGVQKKGVNRFAEGVAASADKYATESGKYDGARNAAASLPRGPKGSEANFARSKAVGMKLRAQKVGV